MSRRAEPGWRPGRRRLRDEEGRGGAAARRTIGRWLLSAIPLLFVVSALTFVLVSLTPGNAARAIVGPDATPAQYAYVRQQLGLNHSLVYQYWSWLSDALHGNLGNSLLSGTSVSQILLGRLPVTASIVVGTLVVAGVVGIGLGVASAVTRGVLARIVDSISLLGLAIPNFWLGLLLISAFAVSLPLLPATGYTGLSSSPVEWLRSLVLPVATLSLGSSAVLAKLTRDAMSEELAKEYVLVLHAHGISAHSIVFKHALRNASVQIVSVLGLVFIGLLSGSVLIESVFSLPGLGSMAVIATQQHDLPVVQGIAVVFTVAVVVVNLVIELLYSWLDPRVQPS